MTAPEIVLTPYAQAMNIVIDHLRDGIPVVAIDYREEACGNPGMLHGGTLAGLMETAVHANLAQRRPDDAPALTPLNSTIQYLRPAGTGRTFAIAETIRSGRRLGNLEVRAWQEDSAKPVAVALVIVAAG